MNEIMTFFTGITTFFTGITLVLVAISMHEFAHAWTANYLGDPTARYKGRVTLDPLAHLDPVGTMMILFSSVAGVGIGWGRPVPVAPGNFRKNPPLSMAITSGAGPLSNLLQAVAAAALLQAVRLGFPTLPAVVGAISQVVVILAGVAALAAGGMLIFQWYRQRAALQPGRYGDFSWQVVSSTASTPWWQQDENLKQMVRGGMAGVLLFGLFIGPERLLTAAVYINVALALFNLIPLGPLDGNGILRGLLLSGRARWTYDAANFLDRIAPYSAYILFGLIFVEQFLRIPILSGPLFGATHFIAHTLLGA